MPVQLVPTPGYGDGVQSAATGRPPLARSRLQHGESAAKDMTGCHRSGAHHDQSAAAGGSPGVKMLGEGEWKTKKHGADYRRQWRKVHPGIDAATLEIRALEVTDDSIGVAPMLPNLLAQIPLKEQLASVSGDGAYDTKGCHEAIALREAQTIIPTRKNAKPWKRIILVPRRNEILQATRRLGRTIWKRWSGYHRRNLVETKMRCFKLPGERIRAPGFDRQVPELRVRAAVLNRFTRLGTPTTVPMS